VPTAVGKKVTGNGGCLGTATPRRHLNGVRRQGDERSLLLHPVYQEYQDVETRMISSGGVSSGGEKRSDVDMKVERMDRDDRDLRMTSHYLKNR
jgi:hypothetical protein